MRLFDFNLKEADRTVLGLLVGLIIFGLVMLSSASGPSGYESFGDSYYFVKHQIFFGLIPGFFFFLFLARYSYQKIRRHAFFLLIVSIILLLLVFVPGLGSSFGTSTSWVSIGGLFSLQPTEIVKLTFLLYLAAWLEKRRKHVHKFSEGLVPFLIVLGVILLLIMLQPDLGTVVIIGVTAFFVYFTAGARLIHLGVLGLVSGLVMWLLVTVAPYRAARFTAFLHPELDPQGIGYHINQALLAIGSGGLFGLGFGQSRQKFAYLPEVAGDSIFAIIAEELGFLIAVVLVVIFLILFFKAINIARGAPDLFGRLIAAGIGVWLALQAFINISSMTGLLPMTGTTLPFISYGGTSLAVSMAAMGLLLNISSHGRDLNKSSLR